MRTPGPAWSGPPGPGSTTGRTSSIATWSGAATSVGGTDPGPPNELPAGHGHLFRIPEARPARDGPRPAPLRRPRGLGHHRGGAPDLGPARRRSPEATPGSP